MQAFTLANLGLAGCMLAVPTCLCGAQRDDSGRLRVSAIEPVLEGTLPRQSLQLTTERVYGCSNFRIDASLALVKDTIRIQVRGLAPQRLCDDSFGPAGVGLPLVLPEGTYPVQIRRDTSFETFVLQITPTRLQLHVSGATVLLLPDTTPFWRPPAQSFAFVCGTYNVPALCADIGGWIERQAGVQTIVFPAGGRIPFSLRASTHYEERRYYRYGDRFDLSTLRSCMQEVSRRVTAAVGVVIMIETASGEVMRAWSARAFHEPHIDTPLRATDSPAC
jgi:hypothetical protein